jgi:hypothetical protein
MAGTLGRRNHRRDPALPADVDMRNRRSRPRSREAEVRLRS